MTRAVAIQAVSFFFIGGSPYFSMMEMVICVFVMETANDIDKRPLCSYCTSPLQETQRKALALRALCTGRKSSQSRCACGSVGAFAVDDGAEGLDEVHDVDPDGPVAHVPGVHGDALGVGGVAAPADLPHASDAWKYHSVFAEVLPVAWNFFRDDGTRADKAHFAFEDVEQLRQFVETGFPQESAELGDARVVFEFEVCLPFGAGLRMRGEVLFEHNVGVPHHGLEFVAGEEFATASDALMGKDDVSPIVDGNDNGQ